MGCCCFNTLRGAAFFVASVHIYNGLECMLKFIAFPMVFSAMHNKDAEPTPFMAFLPGMVYAIIYFLLGCAIFRGVETEAIGAVKWSAVGFAITEVVFFILRVVLGIIPTPTVPDLPKGDQPFEWNIYKTLNYFLFTIVGGLVYICILFLYVQKLSTGRDEFAQLSSFLNRTPLAPSGQSAQAQAPPPASNNNSAPSAQHNPHGGGGHHKSHSHSNKHPRGDLKPLSNKPGDPQGGGGGGGERKLRVQGQGPLGGSGSLISAPSSQGGMPPHSQGVGVMGLNGGKEPQSPGSPMFPYFLLRRNSKLNASSKSGQQQPQPPQGGNMVDEGGWHQPPPGPGRLLAQSTGL